MTLRRPTSRFSPLARRSADARRLERQAWDALLDAATRQGDAAALGRQLETWERQAFAGLVVRTTPLAFPLPYASATHAAQGFAQLARGYVAAEVPELRQALARAMTAAARCCRRMLELTDTAQVEAVAAEQRRRLGERED